jgi:hypothetical protein
MQFRIALQENARVIRSCNNYSLPGMDDVLSRRALLVAII